MSISDDNTSTLSNTDRSDRLQPVFTDGIPIIWDGIDAHLAGILLEVKRFFIRTGQFKNLFAYRAAPVGGNPRDRGHYIFSYLARHPSAGLTYTREQTRLSAFADASWETRHSTSGWVVLWQSAALSWGSRQQKSIALSTCEAEIIALSEAAKDVVYLRKFKRGLGDPEPGPSTLATDSQSARDVSYNPQHHDRMKHVDRAQSANRYRTFYTIL